MNSRWQTATRLVALLLVGTIMQVYVLANPGGVASLSTKDAATSTANNNVLFGRLEMEKNKAISVNGNAAGYGTTILSGTQLLTPETVSAAVHMESLGRLDIAPDTSLTLAFNKTSVDVIVAKGSALLVTMNGVKGNVVMPNGKMLPATVAGTKAQTGGEWGILGLSKAASITLIVGAAITAVTIGAVLANRCARGRNPSPGVPRGPNDCNNGNGND